LTASETAAPMTVEIALRMRNFDELQARIALGEQITRAEMDSRYYPLAADHDAVVQWVKEQGMTVSRIDDNRLAVFAKASVDTVSKALAVSFARVLGTDGGEYTSAISAPSLPTALASTVLGVHGLQPHLKLHPLSLPRATTPNVTINVGGYLPSQIAAAYGASNLTQTGSGQTIAIYALGFPTTSDLNSFWSSGFANVTQTAANVTNVTVGGGPASSPSTPVLEEATLDAEWAGALAPAAKLRIYGANENDPAENDEILQQVFADTATISSLHQLCICIGGNEQEMDADYLLIESQYMANLAASGVSVLVASGDFGAVGGTSKNILQVTTPTSDPDVTGVGGTTINMTGTTVTSETGWSGSGGGVSVVFTKPSWQAGSGVASGSMRLVPDVAAAADPGTGGLFVFQGKSITVGGTSWAAPIWTGFTALMNQGRSTPLGLLNPRIYPLNPQSSNSGAFRDITSGSNGYYTAGAGFDEVTGLGVPVMSALITQSLTPAQALSIADQFGNIFTTTGQAATFFVQPTGAASPTYAWQRLPNGSSTWAAISDGSTYTGSATQMLVVNAVPQSMSADQFRCVITAGSSSVTSTPESVSVNPVGVTTLAGWPGDPGSTNGSGWAARFGFPGSVRTDTLGNLIVADAANNTVRKVTPQGVVTLIAGVSGSSGSTDGPAASALFNGPAGVAPDSSGNIYVADDLSQTIRKISASGTVSTIAGKAGSQGVVDGSGSSARLYDPQNLALDPSSGNLYVADGKANVIRKVTPGGSVTTFAGLPQSGGPAIAGSADGTGSSASFNNPTGVAVDVAGNVYVGDTGNNTVRKITPDGTVTTLAGAAGQAGTIDGTGSGARFNAPSGLAVDAAGNVYVADQGNSTLRMVTPLGVVTTIGGQAGQPEDVDGIGSVTRFNSSGDVAIDASGILYVADSLNATLRRVILGTAAAAPAVYLQPASGTATTGGTLLLTVGASGTAPFTYQWYLNGSAIPGATAAAYSVSNVQQANAGSYTVSVSNAYGSATSAAATITVSTPPGYPQITTSPAGGVLAMGGSLVLTVTASSATGYQWYVDGGLIAGAQSASYTATTVGSYTVAVSNGVGTVTSAAAVVTAGSRLINISTRAQVGTGGNIAIAGIHISGPAGEYKTMLVRGIGPTLGSFGLTGVLAQPIIAVYDTSGNVIVSNTGWGNAPVAGTSTVSATFRQATASDMSAVGAFALSSGSADSGLVVSLTPGNYTVELSGVSSSTGIGLVELYEMSTSDPAILTDISTRALVGTGGNQLFAGFVVTGSVPATVLVRGIGPALGGYGVSGVLAQPTVGVYDSTSTLIASNTGWGNKPVAGSSTVSATYRQATAADMTQVGAFSLTAGSADSALVLTLPPGTYSAIISGTGSTTGVALAEVYQIEP
jgi:sugar lactone lactonase YvrE